MLNRPHSAHDIKVNPSFCYCKTPEFWISTLGLLTLSALFLHWYRNNPPVTTPGLLSAIISAALFAAVCLRFVPMWTGFWRKNVGEYKSCPVLSSDAPRFIRIKIFFTFLGMNALTILLVFLLRKILGNSGGFSSNLAFWKCTDSAHYLDIAVDWYLSDGPWDRLVQLVFLPGYPVIVRLLNHFVGNVLYSGLIVSSLCFAASGCVLYQLLRLDFTHETSIRALRYLCILPGSFFFTAPMSESLFLLCCASCLLCARTKHWTLGCLFGGYAAFTRSLGLTLFVPMFFEHIASYVNRKELYGTKKRQLVMRSLSLFLIPAGFAVYCWINYRVSGNPFQFMEYQKIHWSQQLSWFFNTAAYQLERAISCFGTSNHILLGLWVPNLVASFGSLIQMLVAVRRLRPSYSAWFLAYFVIAIGTTWLLSAPRYLIALIPVPMSVSVCMRNSKIDRVALPCCILLSALYLYAFVMRWQVW